jgi:hypothetical protein
LGVFGAALWLGVPKDLESFWFSLLFLILAVSGRTRGTWGWVLLLSAAFLSQYPVIRSVNFSMDRSYYDHSPDWIGRLEAPGRIYEDPDLLDRHQIISGKNVGEAYEKLKADLAPNWPLVWGLEEVCWTNTIFLRNFLPWYYAPHKASRAAAGKIFDYLGIRYIFSDEKDLDESPKILENPSAGPKWFSAERAVPQADWEGDLGRIESAGFDLSKTCFAEDSGFVGLYRPRVVGERNRSVDQIGLYANGGGRGLLVSNETAYPGWVGIVNGKNRELETVNHGFRAVRLEQGEQEAVISYQPTSFRLGLFLSLLAVCFWSALLLTGLGFKRKDFHA